jgi:hypothetical protein
MGFGNNASGGLAVLMGVGYQLGPAIPTDRPKFGIA